MKDTNQIKDSLHFQDLMLYRIHEILLIASPYDAFTLEQDGKLTEQILNEYIGMNLSSAPRVWNATSAKMAITMLSKRNFDRESDQKDSAPREKLQEAGHRRSQEREEFCKRGP